MIHARIQEFSSGGVCVGGGSRSIWRIKKALTTYLFLFFLVLNLFYRSPRKLLFAKVPVGLEHFPGGGGGGGGVQLFTWGVQLLFP